MYNKIIDNLSKMQIEAFCVNNASEAREKVIEIIEKKRMECRKSPNEMQVSWGGSVTLDETGIRKKCSEIYKTLDPYAPKTPSEQNEAKRKALLSDVFLMSANAICESGEIVNIDGNGNRLSALIFGPNTVIIVAGKNKIVPDVKGAYERIKKIACPKNAQRLKRATPCALNGACKSCKEPGQTICAHTVITRFSTIPDRIKVIIIDDDFGY